MEGSANPETYLTVAEVAELLKLNQQTVRNWIDQGSLPALRVGRRVRIRRSDFDRLLEAGSTVGGAGGGPSAVDFWSGKPVGAAELDPDAAASDLEAPAPDGGALDADPAGSNGSEAADASNGSDRDDYTEADG